MIGAPQKIDHIGIRVSDLAAAKDFYSGALKPLGMQLIGTSASHLAFGIGAMPYLSLRLSSGPVTAAHVAFLAERRSDVDAFFEAALASGGADNGGPGLRPEYHANYYGAFVLDPDGHNIEVVKHAPE